MKKKLFVVYFTLVLALVSSCAALGRFGAGRDSFDLGMALFNQGRFAAAIPYFEDATHENPNYAPAYLYLGRSFISQSNWRAAIQPLRTAFRLSPTEAQEEIVNLIIDAGFAAALNDFHLGDRIGPPSRSKEIL
jgi:tetratricopeptide (TPR) repeat protein